MLQHKYISCTKLIQKPTTICRLLLNRSTYDRRGSQAYRLLRNAAQYVDYVIKNFNCNLIKLRTTGAWWFILISNKSFSLIFRNTLSHNCPLRFISANFARYQQQQQKYLKRFEKRFLEPSVLFSKWLLQNVKTMPIHHIFHLFFQPCIVFFKLKFSTIVFGIHVHGYYVRPS